jgi:hypothetical protein
VWSLLSNGFGLLFLQVLSEIGLGTVECKIIIDPALVLDGVKVTRFSYISMFSL